MVERRVAAPATDDNPWAEEDAERLRHLSALASLLPPDLPAHPHMLSESRSRRAPAYCAACCTLMVSVMSVVSFFTCSVLFTGCTCPLVQGR